MLNTDLWDRYYDFEVLNIQIWTDNRLKGLSPGLRPKFMEILSDIFSVNTMSMFSVFFSFIVSLTINLFRLGGLLPHYRPRDIPRKLYFNPCKTYLLFILFIQNISPFLIG